MLTSLAIVLGSIAIAALVRLVEEISWKLVAVIIGATLIFLFEPLYTGGIPVPLDEVARGYPYRGVTGVTDSLNPDANDTAKQMLPWMQTAREELLGGRAPLWNQWAFSGYPLLGNAQSAPFYPLFLGTLYVPLPDQIVAMAGLKIFVALLFGFLLIRREGVGDGAALFGSAVFALSIFISVYLYYPLASTAVLVPAAAWAVLRCLEKPRLGMLVAVAVTVGAMQSAGHPETVFHAAVVVGLLLLLEIVTPPERQGAVGVGRGLLAVTAGVGAGMLISAPAWLPVLEQVLDSQRVSDIEAGGFGGGVYSLGILWIYLNPTGYGHPVRETWNWIGIYPMIASSYLGLLTLSLLPSGLVSPRSLWATSRDRLLVSGGIVLTLIAMNWTIAGRLFVELFPWVAHDRLRFGAVLLFAMAAARVVDRVTRGELGLALVGGVLALSGGLYVLIRKLGVTLELRDAAGVIALLLFWIVVVVIRRRGGVAGAIGWGAFILVLMELTIFGTEYNPPVPKGLYAPDLPIIGAVQRVAPEHPFRIVGTDWMFLPNSAAQYGLEDVRGSDPMAWGPYTRFLEIFDVDDGATDIQRISNLEAPQLDFLNVEFALSEPGWGQPSGWTRIYEGIDGIAWRNLEVLPRAYMPAEIEYAPPSEVWTRVASVEDFRTRVIVEGDAGGVVANEGVDSFWTGQMSPTSYRIRTEPADAKRFIATSIPALRGWRVESGGKGLEVERVNGAFVGFWLPAGAETARVRYRPAVWRWSLVLSVLGLLLMGSPLLARRLISEKGARLE